MRWTTIRTVALLLSCTSVTAFAQPKARPLSPGDARALAEHLAKHRDTKALSLLTAQAKGTRWCELDLPLSRISRRIRLVADLAHFARKQGRLDEAWACIDALISVDGPLYRGDESKAPAALGLTLEAGLLYEASLVMPHRVSVTPDGPPKTVLTEYKQCSDEFEHTESFITCVHLVALRIKAEKKFDPAELEQALLERSARLVPRASVVAKLTPERRRDLLRWWEFGVLGTKRGAPHAKLDDVTATVRKEMLRGRKACGSREDLQRDDCVYFEMTTEPRSWSDPDGTWSLSRALARDYGGALDDSCYPRRLYLTRADKGTGVHSVFLTPLGANDVCGSGGWGDRSQAQVVQHDPATGIVTIERTQGHVFKTGGDALRGDALAESRAIRRFVCAPTDTGIACLTQSSVFHEEGRGETKVSHQRSGFSPTITFPDGKAVLKRGAFQFTYPQYNQLEGLSFQEVVKRLPAIDQAIRKRLGLVTK